MKKVIIACVLLLLLLPFLGGSMLNYIGGAHQLDIEGSAKLVSRPKGETAPGAGWPAYGGDLGGNRYSQATQINAKNVNALDIAWIHRTGDMKHKASVIGEAAAEGTAILVEDSLIFCTPFNEVIALNPGTGEERWRFDAKINLQQRPANQYVCRGVSYWQAQDSQENSHKPVCSSRIFMGTNDARLFAIDAKTGLACKEFGEGGQLKIEPSIALKWPGEHQITSPPAIAKNTVIVGSSIGDNARVLAPAGTVHAFDAISGKLRWTFDPIPRTPDADGRDTWKTKQAPREGHANVWAPMSVDNERNLVFLPTSSPSPDFYGGLRPGDNRHADSVVALDAESGELRWSFQTVHHDIWDYDLPAQPGLYSVWKDGASHDVVAQVTKTGFVFVLDRDTGLPFLPVEERPVPQSAVAGEVLSPTQPFPSITPPIVPHSVKADEAFGLTWFDKEACRKRIEASDAGGIFTPPSEKGLIMMPFSGGGANWGGAAFDPDRNLLVVNMNNMANHIRLFPADQAQSVRETFHNQEVAPQEGAPYALKRELLLSPLGLPCTPPPWGVIAGVDLSSGNIVWRKTLGTTEDLANGLALDLGTPNLGGPMATAGGLVFIGAALDNYLRAIDINNGKELWRARLPAGAQATPMSYEWQGRQYVVIYAGGNAQAGSTLGDYVIAFALPE